MPTYRHDGGQCGENARQQRNCRDHPAGRFAQSVDQRVKCADWVDEFAELGGNLVIKSASPADIEILAQSHDLVIISSGKGDLGRSSLRIR